MPAEKSSKDAPVAGAGINVARRERKDAGASGSRAPPPFWLVLPSALHSEGKVVVASSSTGLQPHLTLDSTIGLRHTLHNDLTVVGVCPMHVVGVHP